MAMRKRGDEVGFASAADVDVGASSHWVAVPRHARQTLANWAGVDLTRINGLGSAAVMKILSEIGRDLAHFETVKRFCSWLGLCPGTKGQQHYEAPQGRRLAATVPRGDQGK